MEKRVQLWLSSDPGKLQQVHEEVPSISTSTPQSRGSESLGMYATFGTYTYQYFSTCQGLSEEQTGVEVLWPNYSRFRPVLMIKQAWLFSYEE